MACAQSTMKFVSPNDLRQILSEKSCDVITIDVRPFSDYVVGHIAGAFSVRLSSLLIRRLAQGKILFIDIVADDQKARFRSWAADNKKRVVVYDENASELELASIDAKNPLFVVTKALVQTFADVSVLQGGFSSYKVSSPDTIETADDESPNPLFSHCPCEVANERSPLEKHVRDSFPSEIVPYLFVGSQQHAQSRPILEQLKITHILNITATCPNWFAGSIEYKNIPIKDTWNQNITSYFEDAFQFIDAARNSGGRVLVHCVAGISRSPTITIAYLMRTLNISLQGALSHVKAARNIVSPNLDFLVELEQYERLLNPSMGPAPLVSPDPPDTAPPFASSLTGAMAMDTTSDSLVCASAAVPATVSDNLEPSTPFCAAASITFDHVGQSVSTPTLKTTTETPTFMLGHSFSSFALSSPHAQDPTHSLATPTTAVWPGDASSAPWNLDASASAAGWGSGSGSGGGSGGGGPMGRLRTSYSPRGSPFVPRRESSPRMVRRDPTCGVSPVSPAQGIFVL